MNENKTYTAESRIPEIISYLAIRKAIGVIGILLPIVLVIGALVLADCKEIQGSISKYHHTVMQNVLVGSLCSISLFLWAYKGYKKKKGEFISDNWVGNFAAMFALGVAFFPCYICQEDLTSCISQLYLRKIIGIFHLGWAILFFLTLAYFSIVLFTKGGKQKNKLLYKVCGYIILACISIIIIYYLFLKTPFPQLQAIKPIFWLEAFALWAFGISWLVKGKVSMSFLVKVKK